MGIQTRDKELCLLQKKYNSGTANEKYLFHGPRKNTANILKLGFVQQYATSCPYGIYLSNKSSYSGSSFADTTTFSDSSKQIFICLVTCGTLEKDNGTGRACNTVATGELADCHNNGHVYVIYQDKQVYPEYLIRWK